MSGESFRGNVPAALEEIRQARSGGVLVWFFELLWAYCPESRGLRGTDSHPGLQHAAMHNGDDDDAYQHHQQQRHGPHPDAEWRVPGGTATERNNDSTKIFGDWDEDLDELETADPGSASDDYLWLPVVPPTVLLNFSRLQAWYFTPRTRAQMQREIAFYSVADQEGMYSAKKEGGAASNDIEAMLAQYHAREDAKRQQREEAQEKARLERLAALSRRNTSAAAPADSHHHGRHHRPQSAQSNNSSSSVLLPEPERTLTLGQRQAIGIRCIADRFKREHSSNADELPAPVLKRLQGRLSTAVIVDAFEREYIQGLKVENMTSNSLAMAQAEKEKKGKGGGAGGGSPLMSALNWEDDSDSKKKKKRNAVRHFPTGWICPEGPEQKQLQYDRIVAQLIRKSPDGHHYNHHHHYSAAASQQQQHNRSNNSNSSSPPAAASSSSYLHDSHENIRPSSGDDFVYPTTADDSSSSPHHNNINISGATTGGGASSRHHQRSLPSAEKTAQMLTESLMVPKIEYLTMEGLRRILCSGTLGQAALLQQFVPPPPPTAVGNARFNETLYFRWQPRWRYLEKCTNSIPLDDYTVPANKRGPTFEAPPGTAKSAMLNKATLYRLERACRAIVRHVFGVSQHTCRILRLHCSFKFDEKLSLVLLCVIEAYAVNPRAVPPPTSIPNIVYADAHLPRVKASSSSSHHSSYQQVNNQQQQQPPQRSSSAMLAGFSSGGGGGGGGALGSKKRSSSTSDLRRDDNTNQQQQNVDENGITVTGYVPVQLDTDDVRSSPIRAVAAMSRGEARDAAIRHTMLERVAATRHKHTLRMMADHQGVVKPVEQMRAQADAALAALDPKACKALDALFSRRDRRRKLMKAGNESAYDESAALASGATPVSSTGDGGGGTTIMEGSLAGTTSGSGGGGGNKKRRQANQFTEATETIDDLMWGRQSQLARALLRPVASRNEAQKLPFHRRPVRSLAAECGASGVGGRYVDTMRHASTPEPHRKLQLPEVKHRRAFY